MGQEQPSGEQQPSDDLRYDPTKFFQQEPGEGDDPQENDDLQEIVEDPVAAEGEGEGKGEGEEGAPAGEPTAQDALVEQLTRSNENQDRLINLLTKEPEAKAPEPPPEPGPMPSPTEDEEAFRGWLEARDARMRWQTEQELGQVREVVSDGQRRQGLWEAFQAAHPEYAEDQALVAEAFSFEPEAKQALPASMDTSDLFSRVTKRIDRWRGGPPKKEDTEKIDETGDPDAEAAGGEKPKPRKKATRTAGVSAGSAAEGSAASAPKKAAKPKSMSETLTTLQAKSDFF